MPTGSLLHNQHPGLLPTLRSYSCSHPQIRTRKRSTKHPRETQPCPIQCNQEESICIKVVTHQSQSVISPMIQTEPLGSSTSSYTDRSHMSGRKPAGTRARGTRTDILCWAVLLRISRVSQEVVSHCPCNNSGPEAGLTIAHSYYTHDSAA